MTAQPSDMELLEELVLGSPRGGRRQSAALAIEIVRPLTQADIPLLANPPAVGSKFKPPAQLRHSHHQIARLIASGRPDSEISLITGYNPAYISGLKGGQDFRELVRYYEAQKDLIFVDVLERMKVMGLNTLEEIQRQFDEDPSVFTTQQKIDLVELLLLKPIAAQARQPATSGQGSAVGVTVNVSFVAGNDQPVDAPGETIDVQARRVG